MSIPHQNNVVCITVIFFSEMRKQASERLIVYLGLYRLHWATQTFLFVCFLKEWLGQTIFNDFQDAFVVDACVVPEG